MISDGRRLAQLLDLPRRFRLEVCPITLSVPWGLVVGITPPYLPLPTRIFLEVLEPIHFERTGEDAANDREYVERCHRAVHGEMEARLARLAKERRATRFGRVPERREAPLAAREVREAQRRTPPRPAPWPVFAPFAGPIA